MPVRPRRKSGTPRTQLRGSLWLTVDGLSLGGHGRIALLRAVAEQGSITAAARAFGISYKAAWEAINTMNQRAGLALVERVTGGRGGGSTRLTEQGLHLIERYEQVDAVHQRFVQLLDQGAMDLNEDFSLLKVLNVKTSARNQWVATVSAIRAGAVNDEVEVLLPGGARLAATITRASTETLNLRLKQTVILLVKSSSVLLAVDLQSARLSARNRLDGVVTAITPGAVNAEVLIEAEGGLPIVAIVPQASIEVLALSPGVPVSAVVKASDIVLATAT